MGLCRRLKVSLRAYLDRGLRPPFFWCILHVVMQTNFKFCKKCNKESERYADGRCKVCTLARHAAWTARNREAVNANSRAWNAKHRDKKVALAAAYREREKEQINARRKLVRQYDKSLERLKAAKRRAQKRTGGGKLAKNIVEVLLARQQGLCACCQVPLNGVFHLDHKIPLSRGGTNTDDNVQLLLPVCNMQKYTLTHDEFLAKKAKTACS